ncbi:MAG: glycosyltransferase family 4 protein [Lachnospiraceae bacterium]|nr:glycosyltransferase family 4 protein [Lachnospiraceae bacterium]
MKVLIVGDHKTGSGPAVVTGRYIGLLGEKAFCLKSSAKPLRALELFCKLPFASVVLCSGYSAQNILAAKGAHVFRKKCAYLMHGSVDHENEINLCPDPKMTRVEYETMRHCDRIFAVSGRFAAWLGKRYPEFSDKIEAQTNGIDQAVPDGQGIARKPGMLLTVGGGMPRKRINRICEAVSSLKKKEGFQDLCLTVIGAKGAFSDAIDRYDFVRDLGVVDQTETARLFREASLFIQNSCFETFGLAPMEALAAGCDLLLSEEIGALELFDEKKLPADYLIKDCENSKEIAEKIEKAAGSGNAALFGAALYGEITWKDRTDQLMKKLENLSI